MKIRTHYILFILIIINLCFGCRKQPFNDSSHTGNREIQTALDTCSSIASTQILLEKYQQEGNLYGQMMALKRLGKSYRNKADFGEAIKMHEKEFRIATQLHDTSAMIQALNELGTNFRRIGVLEDASDYHYKALALAEKVEDTTYTAQKNKVVSLNGLGNVMLTLGNYTAAETVFRRAMAGEKKLKSALGQAINAANIGAIFDRKEQYDSAYYYYTLSLRYNREAKSDLGISLCYGYLGSLNEKKGEYIEARQNYEKAYQIMTKNVDSWHWLESCISLARINMVENRHAEALKYLEKAKETATDIKSIEHLSEIYDLYYRLYKSESNYPKALDCFIKRQAYQDSVKNEKNIMAINNLRVNYEREKGHREVIAANNNLTAERKAKHLILIGGLVIFLLLSVLLATLAYLLRMRIRAQRAMREVERMRTSFFTNVTHEFRTPLTVILGMTERLHRTDLKSDEREESLHTLEKQGQVLLRLINQLLDMSKVMSKEYTPQWCEGNIVIFLRTAIETYKPYAAQKNIHLVLNSKETETIIDFVPEYWEKILRNLLSNALKYTPHNGEINVSLTPQGKEVVWTVSDSGKGITSTDLPHLFDEFYRGADSHRFTGSGIGLAFVRQMVNVMGGTISAANKPEGGAIFSIRLPRHSKLICMKPHQETKPTFDSTPDKIEISTFATDISATEYSTTTERTTPARQDSDNGRPIILIVEDNEDIANYEASILKKEYQLEYATNGKEGFEKALDTVPDLIITDLMMPDTDGYTLTEQVRASELLNHIPVIVVTAKCTEDDRLVGWKKGVDVYLTKPFKAEELVVCVKKLLQKQQLLREKFSNAPNILEAKKEIEILSPVDKLFLDRCDRWIAEQVNSRMLSSETLADKMCISRSQLNRKIKAITGENTAAYILLFRMNHACQLLTSTQLTIGEIADRCGFEDQSHFARCFKQQYGTSPSLYRKDK